MDRANFVRQLGDRYAARGLAKIPGAVDPWGTYAFHRRDGTATLTVFVERSLHYTERTTVSFGRGQTLGIGGSVRIGDFLSTGEQGQLGVVAPTGADVWWFGYTGEVIDGIASATAIAIPRFLRSGFKSDAVREAEALESMIEIASIAASLRPAAAAPANRPPAEWVSAAAQWIEAHYHRSIGATTRSRDAKRLGLEAWQHRVAGLI